MLIIVMEYCEGKLRAGSITLTRVVGDLGYHIKLKAKKNEYFTEEEVLNWFT